MQLANSTYTQTLHIHSPPHTYTLHIHSLTLTHSPFLSVWSNADHLYDDFPRHWSGPVVCLSGMIRIDGKPYRLSITMDA